MVMMAAKTMSEPSSRAQHKEPKINGGSLWRALMESAIP